MAIWTIASTGKGGRMVIDGGVSTDSPEAINLLELEKSDEAPSDSGFGPEQLNTSITVSEAVPVPTLAEGPGILPTASLVLSDSIRLSGSKGQVASTFVGSSLEARSPKNRVVAGAKNGATRASEAAVEEALKYLKRHQRNDGSWTTRFDESPCQGQCDHSGIEQDPHEIAATGLALLCFLGAGHTMHTGEYSEEVSKGVYYLTQRLRISSARGTWLASNSKSEMYEHGIATLALCEALQMTGDTSLIVYCEAAITHIIYAQHIDGGWGYNPKQPGDLSIAGWQIMALKSAFSAKIAVPPETIRGVDAFLRKQASGDFMFVYNTGMKPTASMTAIGTFIKMIRGVSKSDPSIRRAIEYLSKTAPNESDVYFNYYASQVLFHFGGKFWENWNDRLREYLIKTQGQSGHTAGSWWFPGDSSNIIGGRLYVTTMACLTLEVYYRYLPVYETTSEEFKF
jgi:hypothetical protein